MEDQPIRCHHRQKNYGVVPFVPAVHAALQATTRTGDTGAKGGTVAQAATPGIPSWPPYWLACQASAHAWHNEDLPYTSWLRCASAKSSKIHIAAHKSRSTSTLVLTPHVPHSRRPVCRARLALARAPSGCVAEQLPPVPLAVGSIDHSIVCTRFNLNALSFIPWPLGQGTIQHAHRGPHSNFFPS